MTTKKKSIISMFTAALLLVLLTLTPFTEVKAAYSTSKQYLTIEGHVQNIGWMDYCSGTDVTIGTTGQSLRLEAMDIDTRGIQNSTINVQAHVQNIGWMNPIGDGNIAGTTGQSLRMEAIKLSLVNAPGYHLEYRSHIQNIGWTNWVTDGQVTGTTGQSLRMEALQVKLVKDSVSEKPIVNNFTVPSGSAVTFVSKGISLSTFAQNESTQGTNKFSNAIADCNTILNYADPTKNTELTQTGQFMILSQYTDCISVNDLNSFLQGKGALEGQGQAFIDAARDNNINVIGLVGICMWETGYGTSKLSKGILVGNSIVYNFFGIGAYDASANTSGANKALTEGWNTPAGAIKGGANWISSNYIHNNRICQEQNTVYKMRWNSDVIWHQYSTDVNWPKGISKKICELYQYCYNTNFDFEIPTY